MYHMSDVQHINFKTTVKHHVGCVSFLNSKPLIDALVGQPDVEVLFAVPSQLLRLVETGQVSTALLSIVDYQMSVHDLLLVPAGAIGSDGPTMTVRIFSKVPAEKITVLHADTDSHTSVILGQVVLHALCGITPELRPLPAQELHPATPAAALPESILLIGDKVVTAAPPADVYHYQLDLGEQWKKITGLPFIFAMWMMRADMVDLELARKLAEARRHGTHMTEALLDRYATAKGWPRELAHRYFVEYMRYEVTEPGRQAVQKFFDMAVDLGLLEITRPVKYLELSTEHQA
jgi:chorismate dehydratase